LQEKEKLFVKMQISSVAVAVIFFCWQIFSKVPPEKYGFLPYKVVVSFIIWPFFIKILRKFWENVLFYCTFNYFTHFGVIVC
jgi:hypothetical protein